jgi:hypothetical protein
MATPVGATGSKVRFARYSGAIQNDCVSPRADHFRDADYHLPILSRLSGEFPKSGQGAVPSGYRSIANFR